MKALVVGSSVIDLFLNIEDLEKVKVEGSNATFQIGDKVPVNIKNLTIGGNGANVGVGLSRLGVPTELFTYLGRDIFSKEIEESLKKESVTIFLDEKNRSERSSLSFIFDIASDRIIFSHHEVHPHAFHYQEESRPDLLFLTSIGDTWEQAYQEVLEFIKANNIQVALNPGSHQLEKKTDLVLEVVQNTSILFVNKQEAEKILSWKDVSTNGETSVILTELKKFGPQTVVVTDSNNGAYIRDREEKAYHINAQGEEFTEKTGAGDAFTSGFLAKKIMSGTTEECLRWGSMNAYACMQKVGAQNGILTKDEMQESFEKLHDKFHVNPL